MLVGVADGLGEDRLGQRLQPGRNVSLVAGFERDSQVRVYSPEALDLGEERGLGRTRSPPERTLERGSLREFDNRVLFQMSAADSSNLIDSPAGNKLGFNRALSFSEEQGLMEKFRPYALPPKEWLERVRARS